jgi:hypothetical protein
MVFSQRNSFSRLSFLVLSLILGLSLAVLPALADEPEVTITRLENLPSKLIYFDDTPVRLVFFLRFRVY